MNMSGIYAQDVNSTENFSVSTNNAINLNSNPVPINQSKNVSISSINSASSSLKKQIEASKEIPKTVKVASKEVSPSDYLYLMVKGLNINPQGSTGMVTYTNKLGASNSRGDTLSGQLRLSEYLKLAQELGRYMDAQGKAPDYIQSSRGKIKYESLIYLFSRVLDFKTTHKRLPNYISLVPLNQVKTIPVAESRPAAGEPGNSSSSYLEASKNCQVNDPSIKALANSLTSKLTSAWAKAEAIFRWVRDNISYSFYYNTKYGAVNTLKNKKGNCVDQSHLLIALARAAGIESRYAHGSCAFTSGNVYGHIWAELLLNGNWVKADTSHSLNSLGVIKNWNTESVTIKGVYRELGF